MTKRAPLPSDLIGVPFRTRDAAPDLIPRSRLRASDLNRTIHGTRSTQLRLTLEERCALVQLRMPASSFFSHETAALLLGMPLPPHRSTGRPIHVTVASPARAPHANGIHGHSVRVREFDTSTLPSGLRVSSATRTWLDLGQRLSRPDLVAVGDFIVFRRHPLASIEDLSDALARKLSPRGLRPLRAALPLIRDRAESRQESLLRVLLVSAGFPEPKVNHVVTDDFGEFVARTDMLLVDLDVVLEYMGDYHRTTKEQWRRDMTRRSRLEASGRRVMELNADDLRDPGELAARIRAFIALARPGVQL